MHTSALPRALFSLPFALATLFATEAAAAPAVVRAPATPVLESTAPAAKVLETLDEGTKIDVSETVTDGRRRLTLPSGQIGFIDDAAIELAKEEPAAKQPARPPAAERPAKKAPPRMPIFVADYGHLAELTRSDPEIFERAQLMERRQSGASLIAHLGIGMGVGMFGLLMIDRVASGEWRKGPEWAAIGGAIVAVVSALIAWNYAPDRGDMVDAVNLWNLRHPDKPLAP
jgi:hypothetical protein